MTLANTFISLSKHRVAIFKFVVERLYMHKGVHSKLKKCSHGLYIVKYNVQLFLAESHSGVTTLGHAEARALATSGRAPATSLWLCPTGAALMVVLLIASRALNGLEIEQRSTAMHV